MLQQQLVNLALQQATAKQWLATINNMKKSGVREEEIQWSGLRQFLQLQSSDDVISKANVISNLDFRNIRLELSSELVWSVNGGLLFKEVAQLMPHQVVYRAALKLDDDCLCNLRYIDGDFTIVLAS